MAKNLTFGIDFKQLVDPKGFFEELRRPIGRAATNAMQDAADFAKKAVRDDVRKNFRNRMRGNSRFENSFKAKEYHGRGEFSYSPAANIWANPSWADVFEEGKTIRSSRYDFLAIPTEEAERLGFDQQNLKGRARRKSATQRADEHFEKINGDGTFVIETDSGGLMVAGRNADGSLALLFRLQKQAREKKRLSIEERAREALALMPLKFRQHFKT